jgi:YVTN family beta-propeller protein
MKAARLTTNRLRTWLWLVGACSIVLAATADAGKAGDLLGPCALTASKDGRTLYVAHADGRQVAFVDLDSRKVTRSIRMPAEPSGMALSPDGGRLYVTCAAPQSTVLAMDAASGEVTARIPCGHTAIGPAVSPDGKRLYVCNRFDNDVSVIDLATNRTVLRVPAEREPVAAAVAPGGGSVLVINHLSAGRADAYPVAAGVMVVDTKTHRTAVVRLPNGATGLRGVCASPDGRYAYATHLVARYELPTTQVGYGWMNANALSVIDTAERRLVGTVLLDDMDRGAANPWGVACTADSQSICVTHAGTHELSVIDAPALLKKLLAMPTEPDAISAGEVVYDDRNEILDYFRRYRAGLAGKGNADDYEDRRLYTLGTAADVSNDLTFLEGLRRRISLNGKGPRAVTVVGSKAYVAEYFTDTLTVVSLEADGGGAAGTIALGPRPHLTARRRGEMLFNDAGLCFEHWQSCASCHPDARTDGLNWDLLNDGVGNLKNTKSMLLAHKTPPAMAAGVRPSAEAAVRAGIKHILFAECRQEDAAAIDEYLKSLRPVPSPYLVNGRLGPAAQRGKSLFFSDKVGCAKCHPAPLYTDLQTYDVASKSPCDYRAEFDTPALTETWRTAPYLHDGRYATIKEVITKGKHGKQHGDMGSLTQDEIRDLVEYVLSL